MIKKIAITLCAIIIGFSTIFINNNLVKAEETTINYSIINYPPLNVTYAEVYKQPGGYKNNGLTGTYNEEINGIRLEGTIREDVTNNSYLVFTNPINVINGSEYSVYIYSTNASEKAKIYSEDVSTYEKGYFINRFYKFTATTDTVTFLLELEPNHTENIYSGYYTLLLWQGDWELNAEIVNSMSYQIGYNEGKIKGYEQGYNKGSTNGYDKGIKDGLKTNVSNNYIFNYMKDWKGSIGYDNSLTNKGNFNLTSDNKSIYASGYYELIKNDTSTTEKTYQIWLKASTNSKKFNFGYKDLIYKGLPTYTNFVMTLSKNNTEKTYACYLDNDGKVRSPDWDVIRYDTETYLKDIIIESRISTEENKLNFTKNYDLKNYPSIEITSNEEILLKSSYESGYNNAKDFYYNNWYIGRYQKGYNDGTSNAGNYTFLSLMGAVVDAPIKAISDMLNFEILGFNMMQFFYAIITVCIIVTIVKLLL